MTKFFIEIKHALLLMMICISLVSSTASFAGGLAISSFSPSSGPIGTEVIILGANFSPTPANNTVFFGATQATVTAATNIQLTVTVPSGATYMPITVLTAGVLAYSSTPFLVTFEGADVNANSFAARVDYSIGSGSNAYSVAIGDLDGDGKPDLAVANLGNDKVSVFRNTGTGDGNISYAAKVDFTTGGDPISVEVADLDGDGMLDLAVVNNLSYTVSVLRNISSGIGNIDFASKVDYATGNIPSSLAIGDLDKDGKADLAVNNTQSNTVSVFRNTSSGVGNISFAAKDDYSTGSDPRSIEIGDLDGDGKVDLAIACRVSNVVYVLENSSSGAGNINFETGVFFSTGSGSNPWSIGIGDLDGDGKTDLALANNNSKVSVFRNTSSGAGNINFDTKVDYTVGSAPRSIAINDLDGDGMADLAVANYSGHTVSALMNTSPGSGTISYAAKVDYATANNPFSVSLGDLSGDGKTDMVVANFGSDGISVHRHSKIDTDILTFSFAEQSEAAIVNSGTHTVDIEVDYGTNLNSLVAAFTLSDAASVEVSASNQTSGITTNDFSSSVTYTIIAEDGGMQDWLVDVTVAPDVTAPLLSSLSPADGATNVAVNENVVITFDEAIQTTGTGTGGLTIKNGVGTTFATYTFPSANASFSGSALTINPTSDLAYNSDYYITISNDAVEDAAGNAFIGISANSTWNFSTEDAPDTSAPTITTLSPLDNSTTVGLSDNLVITFNEDVQASGSGFIQILNGSGTAKESFVLPNANVIITGNIITINPTSDFSYSSDYYMFITTDALEDLVGNTFAGISGNSAWNFTTEAPADVTAPSLSSLSPTDDATNVAINENVVITFNEAIQTTGTGGLTIKNGVGTTFASYTFPSANASFSGSTLTINPTSDFAYSSDYYITISNDAVEDPTGNVYAGISANSTWNFSTEAVPDVTVPTITSLSPSDNATNVSLSADLVLTADESITPPLSGSIIIKKATVTVKTIPFNDASVDFTGSVMTVTGALSNLDYSTDYWVNVAGVKDLAGNILPQTNAVTWNFTTGVAPDITAPSPITYTPLDNATGVSVSNDLTLTFDEAIQLTGAAVLKQTGGAVIPSSSTVSGNTLTINPTSNLLNITQYYIEIASGVIKDLAGNSYTGFSGNSAWNFTTVAVVDNTAPTVTSLSPIDGAIDVEVTNRIFTMTFDENVVKESNGGWYVELLKNGIRVDFLNTTDNVSVLTVSGSTATIDFSGQGLADFTYNTSYSLRVVNLVEDASGNRFTGWTDLTTWNFTTESDPVITWNGSTWSGGSVPSGGDDDVVINGDYSLDANGTFDVANLTINPSFTLTLDNNNLLEIDGDLTNNGSLLVESGSSLLTYAANSFTGNDAEIRRNTRYLGGQYSFVGTPVMQNVNVTDATVGSYVYYYDETESYVNNNGVDRWKTMTGQLVPATGYTQANQQEIIFTGVPNTGMITHTGAYTDQGLEANKGWNLVANPYTAAINISDFFVTNTNNSGSVYIWDDNGSNIQRGSNDDYIVANGTMANSNVPGDMDADRYNDHLGSAQAFFVKLDGLGNSNTVFNEGMRRGDKNGDANFFRETPLPIARINLTDDQGLFKQAVVGFAEDATDSKLNRTYDAQAFNASSDYGMYTIKAGRSLTLNGMTRDWETIQIQLNTKEAGQYQISVQLEGYENELYLRDNLSREVIDLRSGRYSFTANAGIDTDRFELLSSPANVLGLEANDVLIYAHNSILHIQQERDDAKEYQLFNMNGQKLLTTSVTTKVEVNLSAYAKGIYLVFDGQKTHKIILD